MKTIIAALIAIGALAGSAQAATHVDAVDGARNSNVLEWCGYVYRGH